MSGKFGIRLTDGSIPLAERGTECMRTEIYFVVKGNMMSVQALGYGKNSESAPVAITLEQLHQRAAQGDLLCSELYRQYVTMKLNDDL